MLPTKKLLFLDFNKNVTLSPNYYPNPEIDKIYLNDKFYTLQNIDNISNQKNNDIIKISNTKMTSYSNENESNLKDYYITQNDYYTSKSQCNNYNKGFFKDFQEENINKIYQPEYLITIPNSLRGKQNLSSRFMHNFYLNRKEIEFDNNPKQILKTKKKDSQIFDDMIEMIPDETRAGTTNIFKTKINPFSVNRKSKKQKNKKNIRIIKKYKSINNLKINDDIDEKNTKYIINRNAFSMTKLENKKQFPNDTISKKEKNKNLFINNINEYFSPENKYLTIQNSKTYENNILNNSELEPEKFISTEFRIICQIGKGEFGELFSVLWKKNNKKYVLKVQQIYRKEQINQINNEVKLVKDFYKKTKSNGIIRIYDDLWERAPNGFIFHHTLMEFVEKDWEKEILMRINHKKLYSEKNLINILGQLISTCALLQKNKISHRDIKPQNILCKNGKYKLSDFGEAKFLEKNGTIIQRVRGTELFMSPICFYGLKYGEKPFPKVKHNTYKSDVYSLGMCAYYAATLNIMCLAYIREINDMNEVEKIVRNNLSFNYSENFISFILEMLEINENLRPDFINLEQQMMKKE